MHVKLPAIVQRTAAVIEDRLVEERTVAASYGVIVVTTNSTMATMEERVEERSYGGSMTTTECAMAAMKRTMEE